MTEKEAVVGKPCSATEIHAKFQPRNTLKTRNESQKHRRLPVVATPGTFRVIRVFRGSVQHASAAADFNHESHEIHETNRKNTGNRPRTFRAPPRFPMCSVVQFRIPAAAEF